MTESHKLVMLGVITGVHGIRGEVVIRSETANPGDIASYGPLTDEVGVRRFAIKVRRVTDKGVIAAIDGVVDRTAAEGLKGVRLHIERSRLPATNENEFYHSDLVGLEAVDADGKVLGEVVAIHNFGAGDILEYRTTVAGRSEMVPFTNAFVPEVDLARRRVTLALPAPSDDNTGNDGQM